MMFSPKNSRLLLLFILGALLTIALLYWTKQRAETLDTREPTSLQNDMDFQSKKSSASIVGEPASVPVTPDVEAKGQSAGVIAWEISGNEQPSIPLPEGVVDYEPVVIDMESPALPGPGETVTLPLPGNATASVQVHSSNENPNGDYSWRGYLAGHGTDFPAVMTYGGNSVFATITTPYGSYAMESVNGTGWVYKNPSEFELSAPGKNDFLEVPDADHHTHGH